MSLAAVPSDSLMSIQEIRISGIGKRPLELVKDEIVKPALLLRKLADFGYEKVSRIAKPGELRFLGDVLDIFPFSSKEAFRIEFLSNQIERIAFLSPSLYESPQGEVEEKIARSFLKKIQPGDYLVHLDHGIGRFREMRVIEGEKYFLLEYANADRLFVPERVLKKLTPYIGLGIPRVSSLKGSGWLAIKRKVSEESAKLARQLLNLYATRALAKRLPYTTFNSALINEFASSFIYQLTFDQIKAIDDIKRDFAKSVPMDRLICGDVGFGKTEVALRAACFVISAGKQVLFLTPTTILADQHYHYIKNRFEPFNISVSLVSRAEKEYGEKEYAEDADLIVGTHKIFSQLKNIPRIGLVVVDEEQKFGVKHKEKFKELRSNIDILSLSATPIPRTFQLALAGLRDISNIIMALPGKEPIATFLSPFNKETVRQAIKEEIERRGQVYYLVPRIKDMPASMQIIKTMFPSARIAFTHGKLPEEYLIRVIHEFREKKYDILIATTIIENGLDLENVNTLIVQNAEKLGLAQAHQIRGRVGRRDTKARAYFFYDPKKITEEGKKRLALLAQFQGLGENYEIAMKDLELRGAGNILGKEQAGSIRAVGLHLYNEMLKEAVSQLKANPPTGGQNQKSKTTS